MLSLAANPIHEPFIARRRRAPRSASSRERRSARLGARRRRSRLERAGVRPDLVCGTSVGALVGAAYASGEFDRFCTGTAGMRRGDVLSFTDLGFGGGLLKGQRFMSFVGRGFEDRPIEELKIPFAAVATSLENGAEVWLRKGSTLNAVRASLAMPGLFTPVSTDDGILVDGALVNPVPVSLARAMGAEIVIAVDLSYGIVGRSLVVRNADASDDRRGGWLRKSLGRLWPGTDEPPPPRCSVSSRRASTSCKCASRAAAWPASRPTSSSRRASRTSGCSTSTAPRKRSTRASARWKPRSAAWTSRHRDGRTVAFSISYVAYLAALSS